jgi:hypothetical protein
MVEQANVLNYGTATERRITLRLLAYWEKLRAGRAMPSKDDIKSEDLHDLWENCFIVQVPTHRQTDFNYTHLGDAIRRAYLGGELDEDVKKLASLNAAWLEESHEQLQDKCEPLVQEGEFRNFYNEIIRYRQCLLPLGENGKIEAIFGGMRYKIFPAKA